MWDEAAAKYLLYLKKLVDINQYNSDLGSANSVKFLDKVPAK